MLPAQALLNRPAGHLADNVLHFVRVLRAAGLPVGTDRALLALNALRVAGIDSRRDFRATLCACLIDRGEHRALFEQAFEIFWKDPDLQAQVMRMLLPNAPGRNSGGVPPAGNRRLAEALSPRALAAPEVLELTAGPSASERERLSKIDFDTMTTDEWRAAQRLVTAIDPFLARIVTRRNVPAERGARIDLRRLLRHAARPEGHVGPLPRRRPATRTAPLTVIVDISGSMSRYSRMFLHFMHALASGPRAANIRMHAFVFGTRLTSVTRDVRWRDPDEAIARVSSAVEDWSGGTRIGECLHEFNRRWARRVLASGSTVLLVTDGLERGDTDRLALEVARLARSCRELVWLNPLLRYEKFEPRALGIAAMLPHVHRFLPVHNLESLERLGQVLGSGAKAEHTSWK
ncbi:MAG TPA: VWA domain-containing protein [Steroidobacteraceae bacterium]|nr:VWA domain-containing protein [Steroidobacteraceae bacterium]